MAIVAIIQARMSSSRLRGKVMLPLAGQPVIHHVVSRIQRSRKISQVVVATTFDERDNIIDEWCFVNKVQCYRGNMNDLLDRYYQCAKLFSADAILRITADCPLIDCETVDEVIEGFFSDDYALYSLQGEFPDGLDCEVFSFNALERAWREAKLPSEREHVGPYIKNNPNVFKVGGLRKFTGMSNIRLTLDEPEDYEFLTRLFSELSDKQKPISLQDVVALLAARPDLQLLNSHIVRNQGYQESLKLDKDSRQSRR